MKIAVYSTRPYDRRFLDAANSIGAHQFRYLEARLESSTVAAAAGTQVVCAFVNDTLDAEVLSLLWEQGTRLVVLRSAGFNHVDLVAAARIGMAVGRVPEYSPHAVAEHTVALMLTLNRRTHRAHARVREGNFALDGLTGHQAFFTVEALTAIAETTVDNIDAFVATGRPRHPVGIEKLAT